MLIEGRFSVAAPVARVWDVVADLPRLTPLLPGCESIEPAAENMFTGSAAFKIGPIRAKLHGRIHLLEREPYRMKFRMEGRDAQSESPIRVGLSVELLEASGNGTDVQYSADVLVAGRFTGLGQPFLREFARGMLAEFGRRLDASLRGEAFSSKGIAGVTAKAAARSVKEGITSAFRGGPPASDD